MTANPDSSGKRESGRSHYRHAASTVKIQMTWQQAALATGHRRLEMFLSPDGVTALAAIKAFTNVHSETMVIERLIVEAARSLRKGADPTR
jgi:hypothetical protein